MGVPAQAINKIAEGSPHVVDWIERGEVDLVINTPVGIGARTDGYEIRRAAVARGIPCMTTLAAGISAAQRDRQRPPHGAPEVLWLQELHDMTRAPHSQRAITRAPGGERSASPTEPGWREHGPVRAPRADRHRHGGAGRLPRPARGRPGRARGWVRRWARGGGSHPRPVLDARRRRALGRRRG